MRTLTALFFAPLLCHSVFAAEKEQEWIKLFNGTDLTGLEVLVEGGKAGEDPKGYVTIHDGMIHMYQNTPDTEAVKFGVVMTKKEYSHYRLRFEYKWGTKKFAPRKEDKFKRDGGLLYHVWDASKIWPGSVECQVQEGDTGDLIFLQAGGLVGIDPKEPRFYQPIPEGGKAESILTTGFHYVAKRGVADTTDGWNTVEIVVRGGREAVHIVNGKALIRATEFRKPTGGGKSEPLTQGRIAIQLEGAELMYRNIEIQEFPVESTEAPKP